jgi:hypothetical protein
VGTTVDGTEQKRIEAALRRGEGYLAEGQRLTHMGSWSLNIATRQILHSSAEHSRMFDFSPIGRQSTCSDAGIPLCVWLAAGSPGWRPTRTPHRTIA